MNIELQIQEMLDQYNLASQEDNTDNHEYKPVNSWRFSSSDEIEGKQYDSATIKRIHDLINITPLEICLTSTASYIREYKLWMIQNEKN